jgi:hypothetical protein
MANVFSSNPITIDTDTTVGAGTNWRGANGGKAFTGGIGIRPNKIIITPVTTAFANVPILINLVNSTGGATGALVFKATPLVGSSPIIFDLEGASGWHDFIVTGVTAAQAVLEIYYRV